MDFDSYIAQAWDDHVADSPGVAARLLAEGTALATEAARIVPLAHLAHHVMGEHLGRWDDGLAFQERLAALPACRDDSAATQAVRRFMASLRLAGGGGDDRPALPVSDRLRVTALAASSLGSHDSARAAALLDEAVAAAETSGLPDADPALRTLAASANGLAATLEERPSRSEAERALMVKAAQAARTWWERAGTWLEVERAEYRLALSWVQAGDLAQARRHAQTCLEMVQAQDAPALEHFFAWEALGRVERAAGNGTGRQQALAHMEAYFPKLEEGDRGWCEPSLKALREPAG